MKAAEYFNNGYSCSESIIMEAIEKGLVPEELLSVATSFSGGMGSGCLWVVCSRGSRTASFGYGLS